MSWSAFQTLHKDFCAELAKIEVVYAEVVYKKYARKLPIPGAGLMINDTAVMETQTVSDLATQYRRENKAFRRWADGYGAIRHSDT